MPRKRRYNKSSGGRRRGSRRLRSWPSGPRVDDLPRTGNIRSNPLFFPEFQVKLAKFFLDHKVGPRKLSQLFENQYTYERAKKKTRNRHRLSSYLISKWVITSDRPNPDKLAALFGNVAMSNSVKEFCKSCLGMEIEYARCSTPKLFVELKLFICKKGTLWAVCRDHGTQGIERTKRWCYGKDYNKETEIISELKELEEHKNPTKMLKKCAEKLIEAFSQNPSGSAIALFGTGLILKETLDEIEELPLTKNKKGNKIYIALLDSVKSFTEYERLLGVLGEEPRNAELVQELEIPSCGSRLGRRGQRSRTDDKEEHQQTNCQRHSKRVYEDCHTELDTSSVCTSENSTDIEDDEDLASFLTGSSDRSDTDWEPDDNTSEQDSDEESEAVSTDEEVDISSHKENITPNKPTRAALYDTRGSRIKRGPNKAGRPSAKRHCND